MSSFHNHYVHRHQWEKSHPWISLEMAYRAKISIHHLPLDGEARNSPQEAVCYVNLNQVGTFTARAK